MASFTDVFDDHLLANGVVVSFQDDGLENSAGASAQVKIWDRLVTP